MKQVQWAVAALVIAAGIVSGGENLLKNPGFEQVRGNQFSHWANSHRNQKVTFHAADSEIKHSGKYSLRLGNLANRYQSFQQGYGAPSKLKKDLVIRGWCKYKDLSKETVNGRTYGLPLIGIWTTTPKGNGPFQINACPFEAGSRDWFRFEYTVKASEVQKRIAALPAASRPTSLAFRINVYNQPGTIWVDDLEMFEVEPAAFTAKLSALEFTSDNKTVTLETESSKPLQAELLDGKGKKLMTRSIAVGNKKTDFSIENLAVGSYVVRVTADQADPVEIKFVKSASAFDE